MSGEPSKRTGDAAREAQAQAAEEAQLIQGFVDREGLGELRLLEAVQTQVRKLVSKRWPPVWLHVDDLTQTAFEKICMLRNDSETISPPLIELLGRLLNREAKELLRQQRSRASLPDHQAAGSASPDAALDATRLAKLLPRLPPEQVAVLTHQASEVLGDGPPLHEALGVTPELARKRLNYARALLDQLAHPEDYPEVLRA